VAISPTLMSPTSMMSTKSHTSAQALWGLGTSLPSVSETLRSWGEAFASRPGRVIVLCIGTTALFATFLVGSPLQLLTDPVELWAQPGARSSTDKAFFDGAFGPFWRTTMLIISHAGNMSGRTAVEYGVLASIVAFQQQAEALRVSCADVLREDARASCLPNETFQLEQLCYQPVPGSGCLVQSALEYFQVNRTRLDQVSGCPPSDADADACNAAIASYVDTCTQEGTSRRECWARNSMPLVNAQVLFGVPSNKTSASPSQSEALIITYLLNNDAWTVPRAAAWERKLRNLVADADTPLAGLRVSYSTESSLEEELAKEAEADIPTIAASYAIMFVYVALALGRHSSQGEASMDVHQPGDNDASASATKPPKKRRRVLLALCGVLIVGMSLVISAGFCAFAGIKATLIISEVIPFLVLAIGVDNIFILVWAFDGTRPDDPIPKRAGAALERVGPSITCAAIAESLAFMLGSLSGMPAVEAFSKFAAVAVIADVVLQLSLFVTLMCLEEKHFGHTNAVALNADINTLDTPRLSHAPRHASNLSAPLLQDNNDDDTSSQAPHVQETRFFSVDSILARISSSVVEPKGRTVVFITFLGVVLLSAYAAATRVRLGLEQAEALPSDSYLAQYFVDLARLMQVCIYACVFVCLCLFVYALAYICACFGLVLHVVLCSPCTISAGVSMFLRFHYADACVDIYICVCRRIWAHSSKGSCTGTLFWSYCICIYVYIHT
jgi:Niemann-Pick C1 protein